MTKREMFTLIASLHADNTEIVDFCNHEIELLSKKSASGSNKPTKTQVENIAFKEAIVEYLATEGQPHTISEILEGCVELAGLKNQRVSALVTQLKNEGRVVRTEDKKKAYFSIPTEVTEQ